MNTEHVPLTIGGMQISTEAMLPIAIFAIVAVILLLGVKREFATFAIAAGVIGALMMS